MKITKFGYNWKGQWYYIDFSKNKSVQFNLYENRRTTPLVQFTGLTDYNEEEIYEGDILSERWKVRVYKDENTGAYMVKFKSPDVKEKWTLYEYLKRRQKAGTAEECNVIIGNIYENPELLGSK